MTHQSASKAVKHRFHEADRNFDKLANDELSNITSAYISAERVGDAKLFWEPPSSSDSKVGERLISRQRFQIPENSMRDRNTFERIQHPAMEKKFNFLLANRAGLANEYAKNRFQPSGRKGVYLGGEAQEKREDNFNRQSYLVQEKKRQREEAEEKRIQGRIEDRLQERKRKLKIEETVFGRKNRKSRKKIISKEPGSSRGGMRKKFTTQRVTKQLPKILKKVKKSEFMPLPAPSVPSKTRKNKVPSKKRKTKIPSASQATKRRKLNEGPSSPSFAPHKTVYPRK